MNKKLFTFLCISLLTKSLLFAQNTEFLNFHKSEKSSLQELLQFGFNGVLENNLFWNLADVPNFDYNSDTQWLESYVKSGLQFSTYFGKSKFYTKVTGVFSNTLGIDAFDTGNTGRTTLEEGFIALAGFSELAKNLNDSSIVFNKYSNRFKIQGTKIIADGSPQGKTAFFTKPYETPVHGCTHHCTGLPSLNEKALHDLFLLAYKNDNQVFVHCNGDGAIDMVLKAHEDVCKELNQPLDKDRRTVIIHSQFVRPDQLKKYADYKIAPSFFTNHAYFWGDVHTENLGADRANFLSPIASSDKLGIKYTNHSDATVTPLNPMMTVWSAVNRESRKGKTIGDNEKATPYQALKAITINAAYEHFDEKTKGSLKEGKLADFVILEKNPLKEDPKSLKDINVLKTIKEGIVIYNSEK